MATKKTGRKAAKKTSRKKLKLSKKTTSSTYSIGNIFKVASKDKSYKAAKKRANQAVKKTSAAYKAAVKKAKSKRK